MFIKPLLFICTVGAILEEVTKEGGDPKMKGSIMLAVAETKEDVLKALQEDIYFKEGVWDWSNIEIHPVYISVLSPWIRPKILANVSQFKSAFIEAL